ncbi:hypothetical protein EW146_g4458 [Bondarzewia mesenterica]|uniref:Mitochondrial ATPase complex subunit ATP10 n=1 Tax=Bondarzewia mesenterica TaxID=1095465 RepID=A0A4S4LWP4_9AGAM|nr:hypothetical protein EW146_g4458 [Bondarzewia mesenterica]
MLPTLRRSRPPRVFARYYAKPSGLSAKPAENVVPEPSLKQEKPAIPEIPPLQRPLGVSDVPTTAVKTWSQRGDDFFNQEKQLDKRKHLVKEASTGYFYDLHMTRVHGGKTWLAPSVLIRQDKALYFPDITGSRLNDGIKTHTTTLCSGRISVISMLSTKISEYHASSYTDRVNEMYQDHPSYQYVQINLQENLLKSLLVNLFLSSLRSSVPSRLQPTYLVSRQNMEYVREQLGMVNTRIGYVYLVDEMLKVRWAACADAKPEEQEALLRGVGVLLNRTKKEKKNASP